MGILPMIPTGGMPSGGADAAGFAVSAMNGVTINLMPRLIRYYAENRAHFLTTSTYRLARVFDSEFFRQIFVRSLGDVRDTLQFKLF